MSAGGRRGNGRAPGVLVASAALAVVMAGTSSSGPDAAATQARAARTAVPVAARASTAPPAQPAESPATAAVAVPVAQPPRWQPAAFTTALPDERARIAIAAAMAQIGLPYVWGGDGPAVGEVGFDCSGLTTFAYQAAAVSLPRTAHTQYSAGPHVPPGAPLQPGDLVFYGTPERVHHVGMYLGAGLMVNAPTFGMPVQTAWYRWAGDDYLGATRPAATGRPGTGLLAAPPLVAPPPHAATDPPRVFAAPPAALPSGPLPIPADPQPPEPVTAAAARDAAASAARNSPAGEPGPDDPAAPDRAGRNATGADGPGPDDPGPSGGPVPRADPAAAGPPGSGPSVPAAAPGRRTAAPSTGHDGLPAADPPTTAVPRAATPGTTASTSPTAPPAGWPASDPPVSSSAMAPSPPDDRRPAYLTLGAATLGLERTARGPDALPRGPGLWNRPLRPVVRLDAGQLPGAVLVGTTVLLDHRGGAAYVVTSREVLDTAGTARILADALPGQLVVIAPADPGRWTVVRAG